MPTKIAPRPAGCSGQCELHAVPIYHLGWL
jgi:hypothetical protein